MTARMEQVADKNFLFRVFTPISREPMARGTRECCISRIRMKSRICTRELLPFVSYTWQPSEIMILRGYVDYSGRSVSNYHYEDLLRVEELYEKTKLSNPSVIRIAKDVVHRQWENMSLESPLRTRSRLGENGTIDF